MALTKVTGQGIDNVTVDSDGKVGIGTTAPHDLFHIKGSSSASTDVSLQGGDDTNDIRLFFGGSTNAFNGQIIYEPDVNAFAFSTSGSERMRITSGGTVLVGTTDTSPFNNTSAAGLSLSTGDIQIASSSSESLYLNRIGSDGRAVSIRKGGSFIGGIDVSTSQVTYNQTSDHRLKENVSYSWDATARLKKLKPARFNYIVDADNTVDGFLAHEVSEACPQAITGEKDAVDSDGNIDPQCIDHSKLVPLLCKTILELEARITALEAG